MSLKPISTEPFKVFDECRRRYLERSVLEKLQQFRREGARSISFDCLLDDEEEDISIRSALFEIDKNAPDN